MVTNFLHIDNVSFSYSGSTTILFDEFSLELHGESAGTWCILAGSNGCGKTTLLKLIAGLLVPDSGRILFNGNPILPAQDEFATYTTPTGGICYCPQDASDIPNDLYNLFWNGGNQARKFFSLLEITAEQLDRYEVLSGGEKKRIQLACALAEEPTLLLLDEPTNHLDSKSKSLVIDALRQFPGMGIAVSHDRAFSDQISQKTIWLYNESHRIMQGRNCIQSEIYHSSLSQTITLRNKTGEQSRAAYDALSHKVKREQAYVHGLQSKVEKGRSRLQKKGIVDKHDHDTRAKIDAARISNKDRVAGDAKARASSQLHRTEEQRDSMAKVLQRKEGFSVESAEQAHNFCIVIEETHISVETDESKPYSLVIPRIEITAASRIALTGDNGSGKSLFIRHVMNLLEQQGRYQQVLYLPQEITPEQTGVILQQLESLDETAKGEVLSTMYRLGSEPEQVFGRELFHQAEAKYAAVSPGELRKLVIALGLLSPMSLIILDEPTNHLDITSVQCLENALATTKCALLVVSHDAHFLNKVTKEEWNIQRNGNQGILQKQS